ncbi:MAG: HEAT repeat domain-containing protein [Planctomycetota bacterium]
MIAVLLLLFAGPAPAELLASKDVEERLKGVEALVAKEQGDAETLLLEALDDDDWEVVHRAVEALAKRGTAASIDPLIKVALGGPVRRIRFAAADSLKAIDAPEATRRLEKKLKSRTLFPAAEALFILGQAEAGKALRRMLKHKKPDFRIAAVRAISAGGSTKHIELWTKMLKDSDLRVRIAAIRALARIPDEYVLRALLDGFKNAQLSQVVERRYMIAIHELCASIEKPEKRQRACELAARLLGSSSRGDVNARYARLLGRLGTKGAAIGDPKVYVRKLLSTGAGHSDFEVRRATMAALARIGDDEAWEAANKAAREDENWMVRFQALRAGATLRPDTSLELILHCLKDDESRLVREEAATLAARIKKPQAVAGLVAACKDKEWGVAACAAVSLGRQHDEAGVEPLLAMLKEKDWRRRGAAVVGLARIRSKKAVPALLEALRDKKPAVAATARQSLFHIAGKEMKDKELHEWWKKRGPRFQFRDPDKEAKEAKKYGYAVSRREVYEDLDVVVLVTRRGGDNIQVLLKEYQIEHREIRSASVGKIGLHPYALFVSNCPGEIVDDDAEHLQWFVRTGGYLFASCWALTHTIHRAFPEVIDKLPQKGQVVGTVEAEDVDPQNPYMKGVFDRATSPLYQLEGAHLIRVLDDERFEVLIDSPQAAAKWGDGNLAGWFSVGHGTVLDSANHFDLQGMKNARLKTEKDRMAFAMDRLGYDYTQVRELRAEGVFRKQSDAVKKTRDLSTFRFITTFVRQKRLADEG